VSRANLRHSGGSEGVAEQAGTGSHQELAAVGGYDELAEIASDPAMRRHARLLVGEMAEDLLQETWYAVAQARTREPVTNLRGYFYRVMSNTAAHMREEISRQGILVEDPATAAGPRRIRELAARSAESNALPRLLAGARRELLHRRRAELRQEIPACSPDSDRYREVILAVAEAALAEDGPVTLPEINDALAEAYPEWFDAADATVATKYQRRHRGRVDTGRVLAAVIGLDSF
jgi:DNA-directed RNA polymerase specialized sigma24 family protein